MLKRNYTDTDLINHLELHYCTLIWEDLYQSLKKHVMSQCLYFNISRSRAFWELAGSFLGGVGGHCMECVHAQSSIHISSTA